MKTKIICTIGPASESEEALRELVTAGMSVARVNCSHGTTSAREKLIRLIKKVRTEMGVDVKIMLDMRGPEIRIGRFGDTYEKTGNNGEVELKKGQTFIFHTKNIVGDEKGVHVNYPRLPKVVKPGQELLLNDGLLAMTVEVVGEDTVTARVKVGGKLGDKKTLFIPGCDLKLPFISKEDAEDLFMGCREVIDWISPSFVNSANDLKELNAFLEKHGSNSKYPLIAKIETVMGVENIDEILKVAGGMMVARGDLGVEYSYEKVPALQKMLVKKARKAGKIVVVATEMHDSMKERARPTRAETTDVANAVWDGTEYIMTSGETAVGKNAAATVRSMLKIASEAEKYKKYYRV